MNRKTAERLLEWWSKGAYVGRGTLESAISALVKGEPNPFVEECIRHRELVEAGGKVE